MLRRLLPQSFQGILMVMSQPLTNTERAVVERASSPSLLDDELLVRDGVGKLYLCWALWTLAHRYQTRQLQDDDPRKKIAQVLFWRLKKTTTGRGFAATDDEVVKGIEAPLLDEPFERLSVDFGKKGFGDFESRLLQLQEADSRDALNVLNTFAGKHVSWQTWARLNWISKNQMAQKFTHKPNEDPPLHVKIFGVKALTARAFWGSRRSIERVSNEAYSSDCSLTDFRASVRLAHTCVHAYRMGALFWIWASH